MPETLEKLRPDRDLQCYFYRPSAIAALSSTSPTGFTVSGSWRQQFDWAVIEWNRDNVFEHPDFRSLPDGDLSGLTLTYEETRSNCIAMDSDLYPTVDWPNLRVWTDDGTIYHVPLTNYAVPIEGSYQPATAQIQLGGSVTPGDIVGFAFLGEHYPYAMTANPLDFAAKNLVDGVNAFSPTMTAVQNGTQIQLSYLGATNGVRSTATASTSGANGNRIGLYTYASGSQTEQWDLSWKQFSGGTSPKKWRVTLPFNSLVDPVLGTVPAHSIRKLRWTYAASLQPASFQRSEFEVVVSNWNVTGSGRTYSIAGPGSRRIEDDSAELRYSNNWTSAIGNFSGGTIHSSTTSGEWVECDYYSAQTHSLYLGTRLAANAASIQIVLDGHPATTVNLNLPGEDVLIRRPLGQLPAGSHTLRVTHAGPSGFYFYFDFVEIAIPDNNLPTSPTEPTFTLATDWDTDHSIALAPERTAWLIDSLGFKGRANHYVGALWFYEMTRARHQYAAGTITFTGTPDANAITTITIGRTDQPTSTAVAIQHLNLIGDTAETLAKAFELLINNGYTAIWAQANGSALTIYSRTMGADGNAVTIAVSPSTAHLTTQTTGATLSGGMDGSWTTDLSATPRVNRAARDWTTSFCVALKSYGHDSVALALSTELQDGDPSAAAGIGQRYPSGRPVTVNTPALQTNFSPQSVAFWQQAYADLAAIQSAAGLQPYLQFGEIQWWYFPDDVDPVTKQPVPGMTFYDAYTSATFRTQYGRNMQVINANTTDPATVPDEAAFLPTLIGQFTNTIMTFVRATYPNSRFEVLYPTDVNAGALDQVINYPVQDWTPTNLTCLKTESFGYTYARNLDLSLQTVDFGASKGFLPAQRSHLVGIGDSSTSWLKEARMAEAQNFESVVLFALDQFCLIGYSLPLSQGLRRTVQFG
jgi:hypothetical protein